MINKTESFFCSSGVLRLFAGFVVYFYIDQVYLLDFIARNFTCQRCEPYKYYHCTKVLQRYNTTISIDCDKEQKDLETELLFVSSSLEAKFGNKDDCLAGLRW